MRTISEEIIHEGKHFKVIHETVEIEGKIRVWEYVKRKDGTRTIAIDQNNNILLTREYRHELRAEDWRLPGGRLDDESEPIAEAAKREFREETGFIADKWEYLWSTTPESTVRYFRHFFLATELKQGQSEPEEGTKITVHWIPLPQAYEMALRGDIKEEIAALAIIRFFHKAEMRGR
ncbi:MAG TPA: NUDIX hydrolase [Pyrinomonadaceae bacterium]|nr:NUDIX hydrolase [Pyrinomonadaceae bacterium]